MNQPQGCLEVARVRGIPVYFHWTLPAGCIVPLAFSGFKLSLSAYLLVGYVVLVLIHEFGHVFAARSVHLRVLAVEITGFGGRCYTTSPQSAGAALFLYSGGLLAQAVLLAGTLAVVALLGRSSNAFLGSLVFMFTFVNVLMAVTNLLPARGAQVTDGHMIWKILAWKWRQRRG